MEIKEEVKKLVEAILAEKEEEGRIQKLELFLTEARQTVDDLTSKLLDKETELAEKVFSVEALEAKVAELNSRLEAIIAEKQAAEEKALELENKMLEMKKDEAANHRLAQLLEANLIKDDEESRAKALTKVRDMTDEQFDQYLSELAEVKSLVVEALKKAQEEEEERARKEAEEKAKLELENKEKAKKAALHVEFRPSGDLLSEYKKFGEALAGRISN